MNAPIPDPLLARRDDGAAAPNFSAVVQPLLDALIEAACLVDAGTLRVVAANRAAGALWGCPAQELLGLQVTSLAASPEDQLFWDEAATAHASMRLAIPASQLHSDTLIRRRDGTGREVERRVKLLRLADGLDAWLLTLVDREAQRRLAAEVHRLGSELGATLESSQDAILVTDLEGRVRSRNDAFAGLWDWPLGGASCELDDRALHAHMAASMADPAGYEALLAQHQARLLRPAGAPGPRSALDRMRLADGRTFERRLVPQYGRGEPVGWVQVWRDLSVELAQQARLQVAAQVFEASLDALLVSDAQRRIVASNPCAQRLLGRDGGALGGSDLLDVTGDLAQRRVVGEAIARLPEHGHWTGELLLDGPEGGIPVHALLIDLPAEDAAVSGETPGASRGCILVLRDQRERLEQERRFHELAQTDALTGLPNRLRLDRKVLDEVARCTQGSGGFALLLFGLDRFKHINDSLGHGCGDRVLVETARRLNEGVRLGDVVARLGGDSFVLMLRDSDAPNAEQVARRLLATMAEPMSVEGVRLTVKASVGIALYPADGCDADTLLRNADSAMHRAKERQGGDLRFYQPQMNDDLLARMQLDHAMRLSLPAGGFRLHYQPQIDLASGAVIGAEGLCRWRDSELGEVSPGRFIPVAEETGFIADLGHWVLREGVAQAAAWRRQGLLLPVSVNVSALQFQAPGFVDSVARVLAQAQLPPELLELELTESILLGDIDEIIGHLQQLADLGVKLAIDDFGTGYSSLRYLKRLPIHRLKIDRDFIRRLPDDPSDAAITQTIVQLGRALGLQVIAEGVETEAQHACLAAMGCHEYQGFLYAPALPVAQFEALVAESRRKQA